MLVKIFCDGASSNNQDSNKRVGGYAALVYIKKDDTVISKTVSGTVKGATNNHMELMAVLEGLKSIPENVRKGCAVLITSDSKYVVGIFTEWILKWKANNWTKKGGVIENIDIIKEIDKIIASFKAVKFEYQPRCSNEWLAEADRIASAKTK